jgi:hypothetical protein
VRGFEVLDRCRAPEVEQILAGTEVAGAVSLPGGDVGERVLHSGASAKRGAPWGYLTMWERPWSTLPIAPILITMAATSATKVATSHKQPFRASA